MLCKPFSFYEGNNVEIRKYFRFLYRPLPYSIGIHILSCINRRRTAWPKGIDLNESAILCYYLTYHQKYIFAYLSKTKFPYHLL